MRPILSTFGDTQIRVTDRPTSSDHAAVLKTLRAFTIEAVPVLDNHDFAALLTSPAGDVIGGLVATSRWGGFQIHMLALPQSLRGRGLGSHLLGLAKQAARDRKCHHMLLDTCVFQARAFYEKHGFTIFAQIDGPAPYYPRYFMKRTLSV
jgi:GNAT superfamily N-acetyltransferase